MKINVIVRNNKNLIREVLILDAKALKLKDIFDIESLLDKKNTSRILSYNCELDIECKKQYIFCKSKRTHKLDLDQKFDNIKLEDYCKVTKDDLITINAILTEGGAGGDLDYFLLAQIILFIFDILKRVIIFIKKMLVYIIPFYSIKKEYNYGKMFVQDIIEKSDSWDYGFLDLKKIPFNRLLEKSIMRKFGYKLKKGKWTRNLCLCGYQHLNKYEQY